MRVIAIEIDEIDEIHLPHYCQSKILFFAWIISNRIFHSFAYFRRPSQLSFLKSHRLCRKPFRSTEMLFHVLVNLWLGWWYVKMSYFSCMLAVFFCYCYIWCKTKWRINGNSNPLINLGNFSCFFFVAVCTWLNKEWKHSDEGIERKKLNLMSKCSGWR